MSWCLIQTFLFQDSLRVRTVKLKNTNEAEHKCLWPLKSHDCHQTKVTRSSGRAAGRSRRRGTPHTFKISLSFDSSRARDSQKLLKTEVMKLDHSAPSSYVLLLIYLFGAKFKSRFCLNSWIRNMISVWLWSGLGAVQSSPVGLSDGLTSADSRRVIVLVLLDLTEISDTEHDTSIHRLKFWAVSNWSRRINNKWKCLHLWSFCRSIVEHVTQLKVTTRQQSTVGLILHIEL